MSSIVMSLAIRPMHVAAGIGMVVPLVAVAGQTAGPSGLVIAGREADARVELIAFRLATRGRARCPTPASSLGWVLQHLSQFNLADRPGVVGALPLDRGPGVIAVVPEGPAALAGVRAGDVLLAVDGTDVPRELGLADPFDAARARDRADTIHALFTAGGDTPIKLTLLRRDAAVRVVVRPRATCPSRVHLARSAQRNAYADGRHVFLTTGVLARLTSDDEVAFVIAHEMAHNVLGHAATLRRAGVGRVAGRGGALVRATERAADALAGELMLDAGFDPVTGAGALRRLGGADLGIGLFDDHASTDDRVAVMRALAEARRTR